MTEFVYTVRESLRARHPRLTISTAEGLVVVVPRHQRDEAEVARLLRRHRAWIERQLQRVEREQRLTPPGHLDPLPRRIELPALDRVWEVQYAPTRRGASVEERPGILVVHADPARPRACVRVLQRWLQTTAESTLPPWLERTSAATGLAHSGCGVRGQRTIWGSCSREGRISLNRTLLFLPPGLVYHVLVHELAHTVYLGHGPRFRALIARHDAGHEEHRRALRRARHLVPLWANARARA